MYAEKQLRRRNISCWQRALLEEGHCENADPPSPLFPHLLNNHVQLIPHPLVPQKEQTQEGMKYSFKKHIFKADIYKIVPF